MSLPAEQIDLDAFKSWSPKAQERVAEEIRQLENNDWKPWYCPRENCDGLEHDNWDFRHARADQHPPKGDWFVWASLSGRGSGKALDVDTPIRTVDGWVRMGDLQDGDVVFDEQGQPCTILKAHDPYVAETMYRVHFSDGTAIDADGEHLWVTLNHLDRKRLNRAKEDIPTDWASRPPINTHEMFQTQAYGLRGDRSHCIPVAGPLEQSEATLPISPYALGVWLGDGTSGTGQATIADQDYPEIAALLSDEPLTAARRKEGAACATYRMGARPGVRNEKMQWAPNDSLHSRLREQGLLHNKHIPKAYLQASVGQRLELLRGLMDTDGYADPKKNTVEFTSVTRALAEGVLELARSLSEKPVLAEGRAMLNGVDYGPKYRVTWRPSVYTPFNLQRKAAAVKPAGAQAMRLRHRMIAKVEVIQPTTVRCITVDSPHSMYLAGRALIPTHNTALGSRWVHRMTKVAGRIALIAPTGPDARETLIEGETGILATAKPGEKPTWEPSRRRLTWPNGAIATAFSGEEPDRLRGPQHHIAWVDEGAHIPLIEDVWSNLVFGLRLGKRPRICLTTTPIPSKWMKRIEADPLTVVVRMSTYANRHNLPEHFLKQIRDRYENTRLGRQEIHGEVLGDVEGALWNYDMIDPYRYDEAPESLDRVCVSIDPAGSTNERSDETGILVLGVQGTDYYVLEDHSGKYTPSGWASKAISLAEKHSGTIVAERNYGGDMVRTVLEKQCEGGPLPPRIETVVSRRGKVIRAEPVAALYEKGKVHHPKHKDTPQGPVSPLDEYESQLCEWVPGKKSPDRLDAGVHGITFLAKTAAPASIASPTAIDWRIS